MSKQYTNSTKANAVIYQKSKKQGFIPTSKKKKWDKTHTVVLILILFWSIGSILGTISFIKSFRTDINNIQNVAYADNTVITTNDFIFNTVPISMPVSANIVAKDNTTGTLLTFNQNYLLLQDTDYTFSLNFADLYKGIYTTSTCAFTDNGYKIYDNDTASFRSFVSYSQFIYDEELETNFIRFNVGTIDNTYLNRTLFQRDTSSFNLLDAVKYYNRSTYPTITPYLTSCQAYIYVYGFDKVFTNYDFYKVNISHRINGVAHTELFRNGYYEFKYYNTANEYFSIMSNYQASNIYPNGDITEVTYLSNYDRYTNVNVNDNVVYQDGYNLGYQDGYNLGNSNGYNDGLQKGSEIGYSNGYSQGKIDGVASANEYSFLGLLSSVIDAPIQAVSGMLNFTLLGVRMDDFFYAILTFCLFIAVVKIVLKAVN